MLTKQHEEDEQHRHPRDHQTEVAYAASELGLRRPRGQTLGDCAKGRIFPRADDDRAGHSGLNGGAHEDAVPRIADRVLSCRKIGGGLLDRQRLAGERRLPDVQVLRLQQASVGRHEVSGVQPDDVAGDQLGDRQLQLPSIAQDGGGRGDLLLDCLHGMAGLELHEEVQKDAEQDHRDDDQSTDPVSQRERSRAGHQKNDDERIGEEAEEVYEGREAVLPNEAVGTMQTKPFLRLVGSQAGGRGLQRSEQLPLRPIPEPHERRLAWFHAFSRLSTKGLSSYMEALQSVVRRPRRSL